MKRIISFLAIAAFLLVSPGYSSADVTERTMTPAEWAKFKAELLKKQPTKQMMITYPGCMVCIHEPSCALGDRKWGYTEMLNYVVVKAWGDEAPAHGSQTITKDGVCVHDHVKAMYCGPNYDDRK